MAGPFFTPPRGRGRRRTGGFNPYAMQPAAPEAPDTDSGILGTGIGPNVNLGVGRLFSDLGQGATALAALATPGSKSGEVGWSDFTEGLLSSIAGTALIPVDAFSPPGTTDGIREGIGRFLGDDPEEDEALRPVRVWDSVQERGLLPTLAEHVGNASLVAGAVSAPVKGASIASRFAGATETSARLAATHSGMISNPLLRAVQHPYVTAGRATRARLLAPAAERGAGAATAPLNAAGDAVGDLVATQGLAPGARPRITAADVARQTDTDAGRSRPVSVQEFDTLVAEGNRRFKARRKSGGAPEYLAGNLDDIAARAHESAQAEWGGMTLDVHTGELVPDGADRYALTIKGEGQETISLPEDATPEQFRAAVEEAKERYANQFELEGAHLGVFHDNDLGRIDIDPVLVVDSLDDVETMGAQSRAIGGAYNFADGNGYWPPHVVADAVPEAGSGTRFLGRIENRLLARDAMLEARKQTRLAEAARRNAARSPAVRASVAAARDHVMDVARAAGERMTRKEASLLVGGELKARMTGVKAYEDAARAAGVPDDVIVRASSVRDRFIPAHLNTPELETALAAAVDAQLLERAATRRVLEGSRLGDKGLGADDAMDPTPTKKEARILKQAKDRLERAASESLERRVVKQRASREGFIAAEGDKLGRIAEVQSRLDADVAAAVEAFDHSRVWTPKAWRTPEGLTRTAQLLYEATVGGDLPPSQVAGGVAFNPHTGRIVKGGEGAGYTVGLPGGVTVPLQEFTPAHIEQAIQAYQEVFQHPDTLIGTTVEDGIVSVNAAQLVDDPAHALVLDAARQQGAVFDVARNEVLPGILRDRPDIAAHFTDRHAGLSKRYAELQKVAAHSELTDADVNLGLDMMMRFAVTAWENGKVEHPDAFFKDHVRFEPAVRKSGRKNVPEHLQPLHQAFLNRDILTPEGRASLWDEVTANVDGLERALAWYHESHNTIESRLRNQPDITLLDGKTKINPAELAYQVLAVTSFQASPHSNLMYMMRTFRKQLDMPRSKVRQLAHTFGQVSAGKITLDQALERVTAGAAKKGDGHKESPRLSSALEQMLPGEKPGVGQVPLSHAALVTVLSGRTLDTWTPEFVGEFREAWGIADKPLDRAKAEAFVQESFPELIQRYGGDMDQAVREFYGSDLYTKVLSFWDNLRRPDVSQGVTLDMWMARLFGVEFAGNPGAWAQVAEGVRKMADEVSELTGKRVMPHELQGALWVFAKNEVSRMRVGHFMAYANDALEAIRSGAVIADEADPIIAWLDDHLAPYAEKPVAQKHGKEIPKRVPTNTFDRRIRRGANTVDELEGTVEKVEPVAVRHEGIKQRFGEADRWRKTWLGDGKTLGVRNNVNGSLAIGDIDTAVKTMSDFVNRQARALFDEEGGDFRHIMDDPQYRTPAFKEALDALDGYFDVTPDHTLQQAFKEKVLGEFVPLDDGTKGVIRIFESGNFVTLAHENGHLLRRMLNDAQMRAVEGAYGVADHRWDRVAEERFADDFVAWMRGSKAPAGMKATFERVRQVLREVWDMVRGTFHNRAVHPDLAPIFEEWLSPAVREAGEAAPATPETGTLRQRAARTPKLPTPPAKGSDFYAAGRQGQAALARLDKLAARKKQLDVTKARVEKSIEAVRQVLDEGRLPAELERNALVAEGTALMHKFQESQATPSVKRTPARWQPLWESVKALGKEAETNPELAAALEDLPQTLQTVQQLALEKGFNPAHVANMSPDKVRRMVFGTMRLGLGRDLLHEGAAGTRKARTGAMAKAGSVDHSIESFMASVVEATVEARTNELVSWVERSAARRLPTGELIPDGWEAWDPTRTYLLTGTELSPDGLRRLQKSTTETLIVPTPVAKTIRRMTKDYDHWALDAVRKVTSPWRTLVLTMSPGWYVRNFAGNAILATVEGVSLKDWHSAWKSYRAKDEVGRFADVPFVTSDTLAHEAGVMSDSSLIPRTRILGGGARQALGEATQEAGKVRGTAQFVSRRMLRVNEVVDEFARSAVYHRGRRLNMSHEDALARAKEALVDYSALSEFERSAVRAVIPFYSWQKGILKVTLSQAIDHPGRVGALMLLGRMHEEYIADRFGVEPGDVPDYYKHLIGDVNARSYNPFSDPSEIVTLEGITRSMNPFIELGIRKGLGAPEFFPDQQRLGFFGQVQDDVNVPSELSGMLTRSPGGRILGEGAGPETVGLRSVDPAVLAERFQRSRDLLSGQPAAGPSPFFSPRGRSAA